MDAISLGACIALIFRTKNGTGVLHSAVRTIFPVLLILCFGIGLYYRGWYQYGFFQQTAGYSLTALLYASVLTMTLMEQSWSNFFAHKFLRFFGKYSYALYVIHVFVFHFFRPLFALGETGKLSLVASFCARVAPSILSMPVLLVWLDGIGYAAAALGVSILAALISWRFIESPFLALKIRFPYEEHRNSTGGELVGSLVEKAGAVQDADGRQQRNF